MTYSSSAPPTYLPWPNWKQALATELILVLMATPKTIIWVLDNHDRENQIMIQNARSLQEELHKQRSSQLMLVALQDRKRSGGRQKKREPQQPPPPPRPLHQQGQQQPRPGQQPPRQRSTWAEREAYDSLEAIEEERVRQALSLKRICHAATGNQLFYKALRKFALKVGK